MEKNHSLVKFIDLLKKEWSDQLVSAVLFGSQVSGNVTPHSDIDLLLIHKNPPSSRLKRHEVVFSLAQKINDTFAHRLSAILLNMSEAQVTKPYYLDMIFQCKIIFDANNFFAGILLTLKKRMKQLGSRRVFDEKGNPYWILKKNAGPGEEIIL